MMGIEMLWGGAVRLETTDIVLEKPAKEGEKPTRKNVRVLYTMKDKKISKITF
jgi:hypothetical protein